LREIAADTPFAAMIITPRRHFAAAIFASSAMIIFIVFFAILFARFLILYHAVVIFISRRDFLLTLRMMPLRFRFRLMPRHAIFRLLTPCCHAAADDADTRYAILPILLMPRCFRRHSLLPVFRLAFHADIIFA
jgi:hypothetical protein